MAVEGLKQLAAPQEFTFQIFLGPINPLMRLIGSGLSLLLWAGAIYGMLQVSRAGKWKIVIVFLGFIIFFLITGSISHRVGARLRFPADLLVIPFAAIGIESLLTNNWNVFGIRAISADS